MSDNYREPEDLLLDESFLSWYFKSGPGQGEHWDSWMAASPENRELVRQAVELLDTTRIREKEISLQQQQRAEALLMDKIAALPTPKAKLLDGYRWIAAASILVLLGAGLLITKIVLSSKPQVKTEFGQISQQQLPDGTEVTLNANSRLQYSSNWQEGKDREVWMDGEAFFHVAKTPSKSRFIVHTDNFDIIVTGTRFNVVNRHHKASILLQEGSVQLHTKDGKELNMVPGDFVAFDSRQLEKRAAPHDSITAWKEQKLVFDKTPVKDVATTINDLYGVPVQLSDDSIGTKTISGILPNNNLDVLLEALEATSEFTIIKQKDGSIIISAPPASRHQ